MSKIIHIESATDVCSVSLSENGKLLCLREIVEDRSHAGVLAVFINEVFDELGFNTGALDAVSVSMGPGSYTGLRIGVSIAKGLCYGSDIPLIAIPTLEAMCWGFLNKQKDEGNEFPDNSLYLPMIDARRMEVYTSFYTGHMELEKETHALIVESDTLSEMGKGRPLVLFGNGSDKLGDSVNQKYVQHIPEFKLSSTFQIQLAQRKFENKKFEDVAYFEPYYLKDFITTTSKKRLF